MRTEPLVFAGDVDETGTLRLDLPRRVVEALCAARFRGARVDLEIRARKTRRSSRANAALHAGLHEWARAKGLAGGAADVWVEQTKDDLLALCWGYVVRQNQFTGEVIKGLVKPHTRALSVEEFGELFDTATMEAAKDGHLWRLPEELRPPAAREVQSVSRRARRAPEVGPGPTDNAGA